MRVAPPPCERCGRPRDSHTDGAWTAMLQLYLRSTSSSTKEGASPHSSSPTAYSCFTGSGISALLQPLQPPTAASPPSCVMSVGHRAALARTAWAFAWRCRSIRSSGNPLLARAHGRQRRTHTHTHSVTRCTPRRSAWGAHLGSCTSVVVDASSRASSAARHLGRGSGDQRPRSASSGGATAV